VLEVREAIEASAARRIITDGERGAQVAESLRPILDRQRATAEAGDVTAFVAWDDEFHATVVLESGNALAALLLTSIRDRQQRMRCQMLRIGSDQLTDAFNDHVELADRLAAADVDGYVRVLQRHLARHRGGL
jgi:DNA-binding GntR family transcriptional regulator